MNLASQEFEMEAKNLLEKDEFEKLKKHFKINPASFIQQRNSYFIDEEKKLRTELPPGTTLRVRKKKDEDQLQFKLPGKGGIDEFQDILSEDDYEKLFDQGLLPDKEHSNVCRKLLSIGINGPFEHAGDLCTLRSQAMLNMPSEWESVRIFLDENTFSDGYVDFEIEVESDKDADESNRVLNEILGIHGVPKRETRAKIERFFDRKIGT